MWHVRSWGALKLSPGWEKEAMWSRVARTSLIVSGCQFRGGAAGPLPFPSPLPSLPL